MRLALLQEKAKSFVLVEGKELEVFGRVERKDREDRISQNSETIRGSNFPVSDQIWSLCSCRILGGGRTSDGAIISDSWYRKDPWRCQKVPLAERR